MVGYGGPLPSCPEDHALRKLNYDQSLKSSTVPVAKVVRAAPPVPTASQPDFMAKAAGLPGGLSLIQK